MSIQSRFSNFRNFQLIRPLDFDDIFDDDSRMTAENPFDATEVIVAAQDSGAAASPRIAVRKAKKAAPPATAGLADLNQL